MEEDASSGSAEALTESQSQLPGLMVDGPLSHPATDALSPTFQLRLPWQA